MSFKLLPSQHVLDIVICESQEQVSSCHLGEISKFLPALGDHQVNIQGRKWIILQQVKWRDNENFHIFFVMQFLQKNRNTKN